MTLTKDLENYQTPRADACWSSPTAENLNVFGIDEENPRSCINRLNGKKISLQEWNRDPTKKSLQLFFNIYPNFSILLKNYHTDVEVSISIAETIQGEQTNTANFLDIKREIDWINRRRWTRNQNGSESQSGVSILGSISEALINKALEEVIDERNFFRTQRSETQSYGDFVCMWRETVNDFVLYRPFGITVLGLNIYHIVPFLPIITL